MVSTFAVLFILSVASVTKADDLSVSLYGSKAQGVLSTYENQESKVPLTLLDAKFHGLKTHQPYKVWILENGNCQNRSGASLEELGWFKLEDTKTAVGANNIVYNTGSGPLKSTVLLGRHLVVTDPQNPSDEKACGGPMKYASLRDEVRDLYTNVKAKLLKKVPNFKDY